ncbi:Zf-3CxxC domain-containing protein [Caenorhabditis elegans]|uniref:Zf-3CxxC domain-containing protein n=1 Tax=Caenorhabditis elegans TaxID=6239 RepID=O02336_CAEEL|nr:Zf-3CxxC domain-containing protein [Caenorhabditis elegans]CAB03471.2 Zf-3CxxC domain-containing protein [Caenorhabditis elegans]|eukprot:NP_493179.2 Uncharacterized protein CELE_W02D9.4 [Caenorhabditis elegans]
MSEEVTAFGKIFTAPEVLTNVPEFSDSLYETKPELYKNLTRIHRLKYFKKNGTICGYPFTCTKGPGPPSFEKRKVSESEKNVMFGCCCEKRRLGEVLVQNGISTELPEKIVCQLCFNWMRLCVRRTHHHGTIKEYPAYRCIQKGCQTFRSVKKVLETDLKRGKLSILPEFEFLEQNESESTSHEEVMKSFEYFAQSSSSRSKKDANKSSKNLSSNFLAAHGIKIQSEMDSEVKIELEEQKPESLLL